MTKSPVFKITTLQVDLGKTFHICSLFVQEEGNGSSWVTAIIDRWKYVENAYGHKWRPRGKNRIENHEFSISYLDNPFNDQ